MLEFALQGGRDFFCASGGVKGCSSGLASARDPDRFWAGLRRWGGHRE